MSADESIKILIDPKVKPTYADFIVKVNIQGHKNNQITGDSIVKLLLGQVHEEEKQVVHTDTVILPLRSLVVLKELLNSESFDEIFK